MATNKMLLYRKVVACKISNVNQQRVHWGVNLTFDCFSNRIVSIIFSCWLCIYICIRKAYQLVFCYTQVTRETLRCIFKQRVYVNFLKNCKWSKFAKTNLITRWYTNIWDDWPRFNQNLLSRLVIIYTLSFYYYYFIKLSNNISTDRRLGSNCLSIRDD